LLSVDDINDHVPFNENSPPVVLVDIVFKVSHADIASTAIAKNIKEVSSFLIY